MAIGFPVVVGEATHSVLIGARPLESSKGGVWFNGLPAEGRFPGAYQATFNRFRSGISLELVIHAPEVVAVREDEKLLQGRSAITALLLASHYDCAPLARVLVSGCCHPGSPGHFERMEIISLGGPDESEAKIKSKILGFGYSLFMHEDDLAGQTSLALEEWQPESPLPQLVRIPKGMLLGELAKVLKVRSFDEIEREQRTALRHPAVVPVGEGRVDRAVARIINERTQRFFGREADLAALDTWLQSSDRGIKLVLAPAGLGKSALLANWIAQRRNQGDRVLHHFFAHRLPATVEATPAMDYLWRQQQALSGQTQASAPLDRDRLGDALAAELGRDQSKRLILVLDGLDEASEDFPNFLPACGVGKNVHVVLGVREDGTERIPKVALRWLDEQDAAARREPVCLKPLDLAAIRAWLLAERPDLAESDLGPWLQQLMTASDGLPLFLHFLFDDVRTAKLGHGRLPILPERFRDYLQDELDRMLQSGREDSLQLLALLTRTFGPIAHTELAKLKDENGQLPFCQRSSRPADNRILRWLSRTGEARNPIYSFIHPRFAHAFAEVLPADLIERVEQWLVAHADRWRDVRMDYALQSGLRHLIGAGKSASALALMREIDFHCARIERFPDADTLGAALRLAQYMPKSPEDRRWISGLVQCASLVSHCDRTERVTVLRGLAADFLGVADSHERRIRLLKPEVWGQSALVAVLHGHRGRVEGALLLSDNRILSWSNDGTLRLWNAVDGEPVAVFEGQKASVEGALVVSAERLLSWGWGRTLWLWDAAVGAPVAVLEGHESHVTSAIVVSAERLLSWSKDCTLRLWNADDGAPIAVLEGHQDSVLGALVVSEVRLLSWSRDGTLRLWIAADGAPIAVLEGHKRSVLGALVISAERVLSWSVDGTLRLWKAADGALVAVLEGHQDTVRGALVVSAERLLSWSEDRTLRLWNAADGAPVAALDGHKAPVSGGLMVSAERLLSWSIDGTLRLWNAADCASVPACGVHNYGVLGALVVSAEHLLSWSADGTLRLWNFSDGASVAVLEGHKDRVEGAVVVSAERLLSWSKDGTLRLWNAGDGTPIAVLEGHEDCVRGALVVSAERLLSWSWECTLRLWNADGLLVAVLEGHEDTIYGALVVSPSRVLSWSKDGTLRLWNAADGSLVAVLRGHEYTVHGALVVSAERLVSWSEDMTLRLWNAADGASVAVLMGHCNIVRGGALASAERLLTWSRDGTLRLWSASDGAHVAVLKGHKGPVQGALVVSAERLLAWSYDGTLQLWNVSNSSLVSVLGGHQSMVNGAMVVCADRLLSWSHDGTLRLWDASGNPMAVWAQPYGPISAVVEVTPQRVAVLAGSHVMFVDIADDRRLTHA